MTERWQKFTPFGNPGRTRCEVAEWIDVSAFARISAKQTFIRLRFSPDYLKIPDFFL